MQQYYTQAVEGWSTNNYGKCLSKNLFLTRYQMEQKNAYIEKNNLSAFRAYRICPLNQQDVLKKLQKKSRKQLPTPDGEELDKTLDQAFEEAEKLLRCSSNKYFNHWPSRNLRI